MSNTDEDMLTKKLRQLQKTFGWSQRRMAAELGIAHSLLSHLYSGKRKLRLKTIRGVVVRFPELAPEVLKTLRG